MIAISLGWGVQSWGLAAMVALGVLPPVDVAIHADTTHERTETYDFAAEWTPWLEARGVRVATVSDVKAASAIFTTNQTYVPAFTVAIKDGDEGQYRRSCTQRWKIAPMRRWLQEHRNGQPVEQWIGISLDEWERMKDSDVRYITHHWPLVNTLNMSRADVKRWLRDNGLPIPVKSSCVFCPYHNDATWREIKLGSNGDWQKAIEVDRLMRRKRESDGYLTYLHDSRKPLENVDLRNQEDHGQMTLWDEEECTGMCFL